MPFVGLSQSIGYLPLLSSSMENSPFDAGNSSSLTPSPIPFPSMLALNLLIVHHTSQRSIRYENTHVRNARTTTFRLRSHGKGRKSRQRSDGYSRGEESRRHEPETYALYSDSGSGMVRGHGFSPH